MPKGDDILAIKARRMTMVENAHIAEQEKQLRDTQLALKSLVELQHGRKEATSQANAEGQKGQKENEPLQEGKVNKLPPRVDRSKGKP